MSDKTETVTHDFSSEYVTLYYKVEAQRGNLLSYIIFLRITPFLPNWFINIVSPVIGVPLPPFWFGSFIGVAPPSFLFIQVA